MKTKSKGYNIFLLSFLGILFLIGLFYSSSNLILVARGEKTQGMVVDSLCGASCRRHPITKIIFTDVTGNTYFFLKGGQFQPIRRIGDTVTVYYNSKNPNRATDFSGFSFLIPLMCLVFCFGIAWGIKGFLREK